MINFVNDPLLIISEIALELKPDIDVYVQYNPNIEGAGCTTFPDDGSTPLLEINANIPFYAVAEILAHELSHVIVGRTEGDPHNPEWEKTFSLIHGMYEERIAKSAKERACEGCPTEPVSEEERLHTEYEATLYREYEADMYKQFERDEARKEEMRKDVFGE